ncbi:adenylate cyclase, partial [Prochlorococcus sp. AH-716-M18]|nr:adenylate cyclase [Prochlorococcus sp. AH-716-M18]
MNNFNNYIDTEKINSQLDRAYIQKRILTKNIYREYEVYLNLVRDLLHNSVEKGLNELYCYLAITDNFSYANQFFYLFEKKISKIIHKNLPLFTVEQLKINEIQNNTNQEIKFNILESSTNTKDEQEEKFQFQDGFQLEEPNQFKIIEGFSNTPEY